MTRPDLGQQKKQYGVMAQASPLLGQDDACYQQKENLQAYKRSVSTIGKVAPELEELFFKKKKQISSKISKQINKSQIRM